MPCLDLPAVPEPTLPGGLSIGVSWSIPVPGLAGSFCCAFDRPASALPIPLPPLGIPGPVAMALGAVLKAAQDVIHAFNEQLEPFKLSCPLE